MKPSKQWKKSSRWRAARQKAINTEDGWLWCKLKRMERGNPVFGLPYPTTQDSLDSLHNHYFTKNLLSHICNSLADITFDMPRPFPRNKGATTIRFVK